MALLGSIINDIGLLAKKGITLIIDILDNLRPSSAILYSERVVLLLVMMLAIKVGDIAGVIRATRWQLVFIVSSEIEGLLESGLGAPRLFLGHRMLVLELVDFR